MRGGEGASRRLSFAEGRFRPEVEADAEPGLPFDDNLRFRAPLPAPDDFEALGEVPSTFFLSISFSSRCFPFLLVLLFDTVPLEAAGVVGALGGAALRPAGG